MAHGCDFLMHSLLKLPSIFIDNPWNKIQATLYTFAHKNSRSLWIYHPKLIAYHGDI